MKCRCLDNMDNMDKIAGALVYRDFLKILLIWTILDRMDKIAVFTEKRDRKGKGTKKWKVYAC